MIVKRAVPPLFQILNCSYVHLMSLCRLWISCRVYQESDDQNRSVRMTTFTLGRCIAPVALTSGSSHIATLVGTLRLLPLPSPSR